MGKRELVLGMVLVALAACATTTAPDKPRELTSGERESLSQTLEPLLAAAGLSGAGQATGARRHSASWKATA